jgi:hypothetical protein
MTKANPNPSIQVTGDKATEFAKKLQIAADEEVAAFKPQKILTSEDDAATLEVATGAAERAKNFDEKIYMFPESYNALRRELHDYWPVLFTHVGWAMANNGPQFVQQMNDLTGLKIQFDTNKVDAICKEFLSFLRTARGVSA